MKKGVRVFIATTEGPSEVLRITSEDRDLRSVICVDGTMRPLPISRDYEHFVRRPTGIVEKLFRHSAFRVDVSGPITHGESWQLGLLMAHRLHATGSLAGAANAAVWASGAVRQSDLAIRPVEHIAAKLQASAPLFRDLAAIGCTVTLLVAAEQREEVSDALRLLEIPALPTIAPLANWQDMDSLPRPFLRWQRHALALSVLAGMMCLGLMFGLSQPAMDDLDLTTTEVRAPGGVSCKQVAFAAERGERVVVPWNRDGSLTAGTAPNLCSVEFTITNSGRHSRTIWWLLSVPSGQPLAFHRQILSPGRAITIEAPVGGGRTSRVQILFIIGKGEDWEPGPVPASGELDGAVLRLRGQGAEVQVLTYIPDAAAIARPRYQ